MNALYWNRDLTQTVEQIRAVERAEGLEDGGRGRGTVSLPELRRGRVALSSATVLARTGAAPTALLPAYRNALAAYAAAQGQLAYYQVLEQQGWLRFVRTREDLTSHMRAWTAWDQQGGEGESPLPGIILSMEGGDPIVSPDQLADWWQSGLRVISLAHYQDSAYAHGTGTEGGLKPPAEALLAKMHALGMILDVTHLADESFWQALERFPGPVMASHNNCRALVPGQRQFSDEQLRAIIERGGVIGVALDAWMLYPGWVRGETSPEVVSLAALVDHIHHICELTGNTEHVGIGSDLDGGFGTEQTPHDLDTITDLQKLTTLLAERGYSQADIDAVMHGNWLRYFEQHLP